MAKTLPANEFLWITILNSNGDKFYITSDKNRDNYYIYNSEYKKLGKNSNPLELERKYVKEVKHV